MKKIILFTFLFYLIYIVVDHIGYTNYVSQFPAKSSHYLPPWHQQEVELRHILNNLPNDVEKVTFLREYAYQVADIKMLTPSLNQNFYNAPVHKIYNYYKQDLGGGYCGLTALFLHKLYSHFGFKSYLYDVGISSLKATHQFNLVEIKDNDSLKTIIQDAYFNISYTDSCNIPLDFKAVLTKLYNRDKNLYMYTRNKYLQCEAITNYFYPFYLSWMYSDNTRPIINKRNTYKYKFLTKRKLLNFIQKKLNLHYKALKINNLPLDFKYLLLLPIYQCSE